MTEIARFLFLGLMAVAGFTAALTGPTDGVALLMTAAFVCLLAFLATTLFLKAGTQGDVEESRWEARLGSAAPVGLLIITLNYPGLRVLFAPPAWLNAVSAAVVAAYTVIAIVAIYIVRRRPD